MREPSKWAQAAEEFLRAKKRGTPWRLHQECNRLIHHLRRGSRRRTYRALRKRLRTKRAKFAAAL